MSSPSFLEQVKGIEPSYQAWEACVLPMNYTCVAKILYHTQWGFASRKFRALSTVWKRKNKKFKKFLPGKKERHILLRIKVCTKVYPYACSVIGRRRIYDPS